jgi:16S rRNA (guanine966-N2)-methyltransferase
MRIISGEFRRRQLLANPGETTRPITDRAKEKLFENISQSLVGKRIADIFCGTGSLGLEAISRGAKSAVFLEKDHSAFELLKQNVDSLKIADRTLCWQTDILRCSFKPRNVPHLVPFEVIFFDPPYKMANYMKPQGLLYATLIRLAKPQVTVTGARLVFRTTEHYDFVFPPQWQEEFRMRIGSMLFVFMRSQPPVTDDATATEDADAEETTLLESDALDVVDDDSELFSDVADDSSDDAGEVSEP